MKKKRNRYKSIFLALLTVVLLVTISYSVNAGCCLNKENNFCQEVAEEDCCEGGCPDGLYSEDVCESTTCTDLGCCIESCSYILHEDCTTTFVPWKTCTDPSIEECQLGCCVQVKADGTLFNCIEHTGTANDYKKDCVKDISSVRTEFYVGVTGNSCTDICTQQTEPKGNVSGFVYYYDGSDNINAIDAFILLGGRIQTGYYLYTDSSGYKFENTPVGEYLITAYYYGFKPMNHTITISQDTQITQNFYLTEHTAKGYVTSEVYDAITHKPIENAYVSYSDGGAYTDKYGIYLIEDVTEGSITFTASAIGYDSETKEPIQIDPGELNIIEDFYLTPTGYTFNGTETCENQGYYCFAFAYQCTGTKIPGFNHTCEQYTDESGCCSDIEEIPDCINAQDTDQKISETDFTGKTKHYCKCGNNYYDADTEDGYCCNNLYRTVPCSQERGWLEGRVKNTEGTYLNGVLVEIIKDDVAIASDTTSTEFVIPQPIEGFYEIYNIPEGVYNVTATMYGYYPKTIEVTIEPNKGTIAPDIILEPMPEECLEDLPAAHLNLSNIKGTKNIKIAWIQNCIQEFDIIQFNLYRKNKDGIFVLIKTFSVDDDYEYIDDGLEWSTVYEYKLVTITQTNDQAQTTATINTGNPLCEGKFGNEEFCLDSDLQREIPMILRVACDYSNQVYVIENCGEEDSDRICRELNDQTWCTSPDACKNLGVEYNLGFTPNVLGMYYYYIYDYDGSEVSCEEEITEQRPRYCYYDYYYIYGPYTTIDRCLNCKQDGNCFDYQSKESCEHDNCGYSSCEWYDEYAYSDFGNGFCYEEEYKGTEHCELCSKNNIIFRNAFCTPELCSKLGACFSTGGSCEDCTDSSRCESYSDQVSCTGSETSVGFNIPDGCASNEEFEYTEDVCDLKICKWLNNKCFKDGNDDNIPDCLEDDIICQINTLAPTTVISLKPAHINSNGKEILFNTDGKFTYYCINSDTCCPDKLAFNYGVVLPNEDFPLENAEGTYNIYFFSVDDYNNTEKIKSEPIYVDTTIPNVEVTIILENRTQDDLSDLTVSIEVGEESFCTDELTLGYNNFIGSKINQDVTTTTIATYSELNDGFYYYRIACEDDYGNVGENAVWVVIDRFEHIIASSPTAGEVVKSPVTIDVRTVNKNYCRYKNIEEGIWRSLPSSFDPNEGNHKYTAQVTLQSGDYDFVVECYSTPNYDVLDWIDGVNLAFTVDALAPTTSPMYEKVAGGFSYITTEGSYKNPTIKLECIDNPDPEHSFGCKDSRYCYSASECTPNIYLSEDQTFNIDTSADTYLCYYSVDFGGNVEETECVLLTIDNTAPTIAISIEGGESVNESETGFSYIAYKRRPIIRVVTNEPSVILNTHLLNESEHNTQTSTIETKEGNTIFRLKPNENLGKGIYTFTVELKDYIGGTGNEKTSSLTFWVEPSDLEIIFIEPKNGVSSEYTFDLRLEIEDNGNCKYALDSPDWSFENMKSLEKSGDTYSKEDFTEIDDKDTHTLYIICNNSGILEKGSEELRVDTVKPKFTKKAAVPKTIAEAPAETTLIIETDKKTICKYSRTTDNYESMENKFSGYDDPDYNITHYQYLEFSTEINDYRYYIICEALNSLKTDKTEITIKVDFTIPLQITSQTPEYFSSASIELELYTNKRSQCFYGTSSTSVNTMFNSDKGTSVKNHIQSLFLDPGKYSYYIECIKAEETATETITFTIDTSPPEMLYVREVDYNGTGKTFRLNSLKGEWKALDNESNIKQYDVSLYLDNEITEDELIDNMKTSDTEDEFTGLTLNDSETYYFKVSAVNYVDLWSDNKTGDGVTVDISLSPLTCNNGKKDSNEADVDCGGSCSKGCSDNSSCSVNSDCESGLCHDGTCKPSTCDDNLKGPKETDIDCGGVCEDKCDNGRDCGEDDDCKSDNCDVSTGLCVAAGPCYNNKLDPDEADVDCGGVCLEKCNNGDTCESDYDCNSGSCIDNRCFEPSCSDGMKNQGETDIDCGGSCESCGIGDSCIGDDDCISENCENNICAELVPDRDNDGLNNEWEERYNEGDLDPDMYDTDGNGISDADEDFDNDGLTNIYEAEYGTDPHKKDTDDDSYSDGEEVDKGTNPLDPDDYPQSKWLFYLFLLIALALLGVGGYFGYKKYKEMQEGKIEIPPIGEEKPKQGVKPLTAPKPGIKTPPKKAGIVAKVTPPWLREKLDTTRQQRKKKRERIFDRFGVGGVKETKEPIAKEETKPKEYAEEGPRVGWVEMELPKKKLGKSKEKESISPVFDKLPKITSSKFRGKLPTEDVFKALSKTIGAGVKESTVKEFKDVAEKKKLTKEQLIKLINKLSKEKKLDEDNLHKILVSILEEEKTPVKKETKQKLPSIVEKEVKRRPKRKTTKKKIPKRRKKK